LIAVKIGKDIFEYINNIKNSRARQVMKRRVQEYLPKLTEKFEAIQDKYFFIVFSSEWSPDCQAHIPSLAKLLVVTKNNNLVAKVVDYDGNRDIAEELGILRIPTVILYDKKWRELGRFVEKPQRYSTMEEELWSFIEGSEKKTTSNN